MRGRSYSYSPPARGYGRRGHSPSPSRRGRYGGHSRDLPTTLLVRNLRRDCRPDDLRRVFGQFGPVKDIYLPRDYYTGEPRGFGFIQYVDPDDAADAKHQMDRQILHGRELTVVFAQENRKKPEDMRARDRQSRGRSHERSPRDSRSPRRSRSRSPRRSRSRSPRSASPRDRRNKKEHSHSPSPDNRRSRSKSRSVLNDNPRKTSHRARSGSRSPPSSRSRSMERSPPA